MGPGSDFAGSGSVFAVAADSDAFGPRIAPDHLVKELMPRSTNARSTDSTNGFVARHRSGVKNGSRIRDLGRGALRACRCSSTDARQPLHWARCASSCAIVSGGSSSPATYSRICDCASVHSIPGSHAAAMASEKDSRVFRPKPRAASEATAARRTVAIGPPDRTRERSAPPWQPEECAATRRCPRWHHST